LKKIWKTWSPQPNKLEMWHHLWPVLRTRIRRAERSKTEERIPLVRVVREAERKARGPRSHTVLRVRP
jgi:hypothetical protein